MPLEAGGRLLALLEERAELSAAKDARARYLTWIAESVGRDAAFTETHANIDETHPALPGVRMLPVKVRFKEALADRLAVTALPAAEAWERLEARQRVTDSAVQMLAASDTPVKAPPKPDRNEPCPCGSGKKYKKCCLR